MTKFPLGIFLNVPSTCVRIPAKKSYRSHRASWGSHFFVDDQKKCKLLPHILDELRIYLEPEWPLFWLEKALFWVPGIYMYEYIIINQTKKSSTKNNIQSIYFHPTSNIQPPWCFFLTPTNPTGPGWVSLTKGPKDTCRAASGAYAFRVLTWCLFPENSPWNLKDHPRMKEKSSEPNHHFWSSRC